MIDIMKLLITEETFSSLPNVVDNRQFLERQRRRRPAPMEFDDETIGVVTNMGFTRNVAIIALQRAYGNVEMALEDLLGGNHHSDEDDDNEEHKESQSNDKDNEEEIKKKEDKYDDKMDDKMDVDDDEIKVVTYEELTGSIKKWLKMLFNWILTGFNSTLTDLDVENITQFMLKYISSDEEVHELMKTCIDNMKDMENYLLGDSDKDIMNYEYQRNRKASLKKVATLTKILSKLDKYFLTNMIYYESIVTNFIGLIAKANSKPFNFIPKEKEFQIGDLTDVEPSKSEYQIFKDIVDNCMNIIIAGYGIYELSKNTKVSMEVEKETESLMKKIEEEKKEESKEKTDKSKEDSKEKKEEENILYPEKINKYLKNNTAGEGLQQKDIEKALQNWNTNFSENFFLDIALKIIEHSSDNFDQILSQECFMKLMYYL